MESVTFPNGSLTMVGHLHTPEGFDPSTRHAALVVVHPGGGVKEQAAGVYARSLAEQGFVALAFDASHQGESGGEPRHLEDPYARVEDVRAAVDHLQSLPYVDPERIGALGICAGGGYAVNAAMTDYRIKALTTVSAVNIGTSFRRGWYGTAADAAAVPTLETLARQRTAEAARGAEPAHLPYVPAEPDANTPRDLVEAGDYYLTPRARHPRAENRFRFTRSVSRIFTFDAFHLVEDLLAQPLLIVAGGDAGSLWMSTELHGRARGPKQLRIVEGATHMDFYDIPEYVDRAVAAAVPFFTEHLTPAPADAS
ncbi:alpha/beta hydrolase [Streptomyces catenulae]|uniref:Alpha/beta hydrolase n=1 Tax=Streptomyces catenulae TaxID=66875 RepID=A0ABV2YS14_9ACTN|nr:alpha/beta hydrolase [Streptomyces catenulae]